MNLTNYYWYFKSAIPERICDDISKYGKQLQDQMAVTGGYGNPKKLNKKQVTDLKKKRNSDVVWMNDRWVYKEIQPYIHDANRNAGWNFKWDYSESCQFTKYKKGSTMIGIVIAGINLIKENRGIHRTKKLENYL
jgi:PKHD-type hydroxylase